MKKYNVHLSIDNGFGFRGFLMAENVSLIEALEQVSLAKKLDKNNIDSAKAINFAITETEVK